MPLEIRIGCRRASADSSPSVNDLSTDKTPETRSKFLARHRMTERTKTGKGDAESGSPWRVDDDDVLVVDRSTLAKAEPYGDCLIHAAGHYERWEQWRRLGPAGLAKP